METLPAVIDRARTTLQNARTSAEVLQGMKVAQSAMHYAKLQKASIEVQNDCLLLIKLAEIRMADEIDEAQARGDVAQPHVHVSDVRAPDIIRPATFNDIGVDRQRVAEWRELRDAGGEDVVMTAIGVAMQENRAATHADVKRAARGESVHRTRYSGEIEWYTPSKYIEAARECMGSIDIDPASSREAQQIVHAGVYYTKKENGLVREWTGNVWLNPPYSQPHIANFVNKLIEEVEAGRATNAILLTNSSTDTSWCHAAFDACQARCFTRGRITFVGATGSPPQGQIFFFFGKRINEFKQAFKEFGRVESGWAL